MSNTARGNCRVPVILLNVPCDAHLTIILYRIITLVSARKPLFYMDKLLIRMNWPREVFMVTIFPKQSIQQLWNIHKYSWKAIGLLENANLVESALRRTAPPCGFGLHGSITSFVEKYLQIFRGTICLSIFQKTQSGLLYCGIWVPVDWPVMLWLAPVM